MKKSILHLIFISVLALSLLFFLMPQTSYADAVAPYGLTGTSVSVGTGSALRSATTQVGFGGQRWYVVGYNGAGINKGAGTMTLLARDVYDSTQFNYSDAVNYNAYKGSLLQTAVNALPDSYDARERAVMVPLTLGEVTGTQPTGQTIWAPGYSEAQAISPDVRKPGTDDAWWLRTPNGLYYAGYVYNGIINQYASPIGSAKYPVRPATAISLSNVLFAAPISGVKEGAEGVMNAVSLSSEIKFTIKDTSGLSLTVTGAPGSVTQAQDTTLDLPFSGASTGTGKYVSCILVSTSDNLVKYYCKLSSASSGTLSIPISAGVLAGSYKLLIFNEQINPGDSSDYASTPVAIDLTVTGSSNNPPRLKTGVLSTASASVSVGSPYTVTLSDIFEDPDGNALSYRVSVNSATAVGASENYSFTPSAAGTTTLAFSATDGELTSPSYTVTLTTSTVLAAGITVTGENGATGMGYNGQLQLYCTFEPSNTTNKSITWTDVCTDAGTYANADVDAADMLRTYSITNEGTVTIRATANDGSGVYGELTINFLSNPVSSITVNAATIDLAAGESTQMNASVTPWNAAQSVTWSITQGSAIASVSPAGLLSLTGSGTVTVRGTATDGTAVFGKQTLTIKGTQAVPSAPTIASKTASTVTLNPIIGGEYSVGGTTWQAGTTFSGLTPNTSYNFYQRLAGTAALRSSPASAALSVTTDKAVLGGSVSLTGTFECGQTLTADTSGLNATPSCSLGTISYKWTREGSEISGATESTYKLAADDFGKVVNVTVTAENCTGSISSGNSSATAKGDPDYTVPTGLTAVYGDTLSDIALPEGFTWEDPLATSVGEPGSRSFTATYTPDNTTCYNIMTGISITLTVDKAASSITVDPTASAITYGDTLADSTLSGGETNTPGSFSWVDDTIAPAVSDSGITEYSVIFTPTDTARYKTAAAAVTLTVNKATPSVSIAPTASAITYGQALSDSAISGGSGSVAGSFAWTNGTIKPAVSDSNVTAYSVTFTPTDSVNYNTAAAAIQLTVNKATPSITTNPTASAITFGDTLSHSVLSGGSASVPGGFSWTTGTIVPDVSDSETTPYAVTFTPTDTGNYNTAITSVTLKIYTAASSVTIKPTASAITYGQALSDSILSGGSGSVTGSFAWTDGTIKPAVSDSGVTGYSVTFTPSSDNYAPSTTTVTLTVNKAAAYITTDPAASAITYGQALSDSNLSGGSGSVAGSFAWTNGTIKPAVSDSGVTEYSVTFIPTDIVNYNTAATTVTLIVNKATPSVTTDPTASAITYGQALSDSTLSGGSAGIPGTFAWSDEAIKPAVSDSGVTAYSVTFTPADSVNYNTAATAIQLTVNKATPSVITPPAASAITYGDTLADSTLSGGSASVAGSFAWTNGTIKPAVPDSGITAYSVTFTPADSVNYNTAVTAIQLTVNKADPVYTVPTGLTAAYGETLADVSLPSGFSWEDSPAAPVGSVGTHNLTVKYTPADSINYKTITGISVTLTVGKAEPSITFKAKYITYNSFELKATITGAGGFPTGTVMFMIDGEDLDSVSLKDGVASAKWTGVLPGYYDLKAVYSGDGCYNASTATLDNYNVAKRKQDALFISGVPDTVTYGDEDFDLDVSGGSSDGDITFAVTSGSALKVGKTTGTVKVLAPGTCVITVTKAADKNYKAVTASVTIQVEKAAPIISEKPAASQVMEGSALSSSVLTGGQGKGIDGKPLEGTFTWSDPEQIVTSSGSYEATFTPRDTEHYIAATVKVDVPAVKNPYVLDRYIVNKDSSVDVDLTKGSSLLSAAQMSRLIALNANEPVVLSGSGYEITFPAGSLQAGGGSDDIDLGIIFNAGSDYDKILSLAGDGFVLMMHFNHDGVLPGEAHVRVYAGKEHAGQTLVYQYYDPENGDLQLMQNVTVDAEGYVTVIQTHSSSYVFTLSEKNAIPVTGGGGSSLIWWLIGGGVFLAAIIAALLIMTRKRRKTQHGDI